MTEKLEIFNEINPNATLDKAKSQKLTGYASIDKPWLKYYDQKFVEDDIPDMSIYQLALESNKNNMENIAIDMRSSQNDFSKGIKLTYKDLFHRIDQSAKASLELGLKRNEIIPFILPNVPEARILVYSNSILGSTSYPVSPLMPNNQLEQLINENEIKNLFIFKAFYEKYAKALKRTSLNNIILLDGSESLPNYIKCLKMLKEKLKGEQNELIKNDKRVISWNEYISSNKLHKEKIEPFYEPNHITAIIGTSGTTGTPKGVCLSDKNVNTAALAYKNGNIFPGSMMDALLPSIGYGISMLHYQTVDGKYIYLIPELLTTRFPEALAKLKPDNFPGGPVHYINLRESEQFKNGTLPKTKNLISGGASLSADVEASLNGVSEGYAEQNEDKGYNDDLIVRQGYGLSEDVALGTYSKLGTYKFGSIGIPMPYLEMGIFKPETDEELKYEQPGELCITGPSVMVEYLNNPEETNKVIKVHRDGKRWIHTKDICYMDKDGNIFHVERTKNIFMRTGFNVHPSKISEFINTIPFVKNSIVMGFEHSEQQCVPIAFVQLEESMTQDMSDEIITKELMDQCYRNLEETSVPYDFVIVDELPINLGGKIDQRTIKKESEIDLTKNKIKKRMYFNKK